MPVIHIFQDSEVWLVYMNPRKCLFDISYLNMLKDNILFWIRIKLIWKKILTNKWTLVFRLYVLNSFPSNQQSIIIILIWDVVSSNGSYTEVLSLVLNNTYFSNNGKCMQMLFQLLFLPSITNILFLLVFLSNFDLFSFSTFCTFFVGLIFFLIYLYFDD